MNWDNVIQACEDKLIELGYIKSSNVLMEGYISDTEPDKSFYILPGNINVSSNQTLGLLLNIKTQLNINLYFQLLKINTIELIKKIEELMRFFELELRDRVYNIDNISVLDTGVNIDNKGKGLIYTITIEVVYDI